MEAVWVGAVESVVGMASRRRLPPRNDRREVEKPDLRERWAEPPDAYFSQRKHHGRAFQIPAGSADPFVCCKGMAAPDISQTLGSPVRIWILRTLPAGGSTPTEMARRLGMSVPSMSRHMAILEAGGVLRVRPSGRYRVYSAAVRMIEIVLNV